MLLLLFVILLSLEFFHLSLIWFLIDLDGLFLFKLLLLLLLSRSPGYKPKTNNFWLLFTPATPIASDNLLVLIQDNLTPLTIFLLTVEFDLRSMICLERNVLDTCWL